MTVHYDLKEEDWTAMQLHYARQTGQFKRSQRTLVALSAFLILLGATAALVSTRSSAPLLLLIYAGFMMVMSLFMPQIHRRNIQKILQKGHHKALFGATSVVLTPKGIQTTSPIGESLFYWNAVEQLAESETHLFVQFSAGVNLIVPKRAFATQTHGAQFLKLAEEYQQVATGSPIPTMQRGAWWTQGAQVVESQSQRQ